MDYTRGTTHSQISVLSLTACILQIPEPPLVQLTNEAIKCGVSNSFELHLLFESFNIPTVGSQSSSGLFRTLGSLFNRDHRLVLYAVIHFRGGRCIEREEMKI